MNSISKFLICALVLFSFMLAMTIAYYDISRIVEEDNPDYIDTLREIINE